jgi:hypothetical protein
VFIGTAVETRASGQNALFHVEETWVGDPLAEWQVALGTDSEGTIWSNNPHFEAGIRYLVVGHWDGDTLRPSGCDGTQAYSQAVAEMRPTNATEPVPASRPLMWAGASSLLWLVNTVLAILVVAVVLAAPLLIWRQRRAADKP